MSQLPASGSQLQHLLLATTRFGYWLVGTSVLVHLAIVLGIDMQPILKGRAPYFGPPATVIAAWLFLAILSYVAFRIADRQLPEQDRVFA